MGVVEIELLYFFWVRFVVNIKLGTPSPCFIPLSLVKHNRTRQKYARSTFQKYSVPKERLSSMSCFIISRCQSGSSGNTNQCISLFVYTSWFLIFVCLCFEEVQH